MSSCVDELRGVLDTVSPATQVDLPAKRFDGTEMTGQPVDNLLQHPKSPVRRASGVLSHQLDCMRSLYRMLFNSRPGRSPVSGQLLAFDVMCHIA